jgi:hypothetical protein
MKWPRYSSRQKVMFVCLIVFAFLAYPAWIQLTTPRYRGKTVQYWFRQFCVLGVSNSMTIAPDGRHVYNGSGAEIADPAPQALRQMGQPAIDFLAARLARKSFGPASA